MGNIYIFFTFQDLGARTSRAKRSAQRYLEKMLHIVKESKDPYEIAIVAYALTLVNSIDGEAAFNILDSKMREAGNRCLVLCKL